MSFRWVILEVSDDSVQHRFSRNSYRCHRVVMVDRPIVPLAGDIKRCLDDSFSPLISNTASAAWVTRLNAHNPRGPAKQTLWSQPPLPIRQLGLVFTVRGCRWSCVLLGLDLNLPPFLSCLRWIRCDEM